MIITKIEKETIKGHGYTPDIDKFTFTDGYGDSAQRTTDASLEDVADYVIYCENQIKIAKEFYDKKAYELDGTLNIALKVYNQRIEPWYPDLDNTTNLCIKMLVHIAGSTYTENLKVGKAKEHLAQFFPEDVINKAIKKITQKC